MGKLADWLARLRGGDPDRVPMPVSTWENPVYPGLSEERDGQLFTPGRKPLQRDPARPIELAVTHLAVAPLNHPHDHSLGPEKITGVAQLRNTTIGRAGWDEKISLLQFHCYGVGDPKILFGLDEIDYDVSTTGVDTWWVACYVSASIFDQFKTASAATLVCTADMWRSGSDWKIARTKNGSIVGRGTIVSLTCS